MKNLIFLLLAVCIVLCSFGQDNKVFSKAQFSDNNFQLNFDLINPTLKINNGIVIVHVTGGVAPYQYKWSKQNIPLTSNEATGLSEGIEYPITVTDAVGNSIRTIVSVPANSIGESINSSFIPIVDAIAIVIMPDIFAALNIYDPIIYDNNQQPRLHPNGDPLTMKIPLVVVWLILGALFFTFRMKFINIWGIRHAISLIRGKYDNPNDKGEVSHFQALTTALSATVGLGNIAGVAIAISIGGPGATFWMIIAGFLGMSSKFVECTLGVKYRVINEKGEVSGGPMYYLKNAFSKKKLVGLGKVLAVIFSILVIGGSLGGGNMFQANQAFSQVSGIFPSLSSHGVWFGIVLALLVGVVIIGGIKSIARVTDKIVPFMAIFYVLTALVIIFMNYDKTAEAFALIFNGAFSPGALKGGVIGVLIVGFQRAAFSNEAGVGSASIAHSAAKTDEPISEGIVSLLEPFIDTIVVCTMTALVLIFTGLYENPDNLEGAQLTSAAFGKIFSWYPYLLIVTILLFAFSTMISWSYYGLKGFTYLFERFFKNTTILKYIYFLIFLFFIVVGSASQLSAVVDFSDMMILGMAFPNILGLLLFSGEVRSDLREYYRKLKSGEIKKYRK